MGIYGRLRRVYPVAPHRIAFGKGRVFSGDMAHGRILFCCFLCPCFSLFAGGFVSGWIAQKYISKQASTPQLIMVTPGLYICILGMITYLIMTILEGSAMSFFIDMFSGVLEVCFYIFAISLVSTYFGIRIGNKHKKQSR